MGVVIFTRRSEAGQAIIRDFQNKSAVHDAVGWLEIPVAANVAVVKIVHSLLERTAIIFFFFNRKKLHNIKENREMMRSDKWVYAEGKGHVSRTAESCEIMLNSFWGGGGQRVSEALCRKNESAMVRSFTSAWSLLSCPICAQKFKMECRLIQNPPGAGLSRYKASFVRLD